MKHKVSRVICLAAFAAGVSFTAFGGTTINVGSGETYTTITDAMTYVGTLGDDAFPVEIVVKSGTYVENDFTLDKAITVRGATGNPEDVKILDGSETFTDDVNKGGVRAFTLTHADAVVRDLTIYGKGYQKDGGQGGHIWMSDGRVENCILKDGCAGGRAQVTKNSHGQGGNVWMSGGRLVRCQILSGLANGYKGNSGGDKGKCESYGAGIYATGGIIENCLVRGNLAYLDRGGDSPLYVFGGGLYADGPVTVANCTFVDNVPGAPETSAGGIQLGSNANEAKVVNCVFLNNGGTAVREFGNTSIACFSHCASSVTNATCDTWAVVVEDDFTSDYHLKTALLVDAGTREEGWYPEGASTLDLDGLARISGKEIDVGCYEVDQSQLSCSGFPSTYGAFEGSNVTFIAQGVGGSGNYVFMWDFGDGTTRETAETVYNYAYQKSGLFTMQVKVSDDGGATWTDWTTVEKKIVVTPKEMFVNASAASPTFPYRTPETGALTLGEALAALTNDTSEGCAYTDGAIVRVCPGTYSETGFKLKHGISIVGRTGNPTDVEIVDNVVGSRAFTLEHPNAVVRGLTVSGAGWHQTGGLGGHVYMTAGMFENCILTGGNAGARDVSLSARSTGRGGNVWMSGGRLVCCQILDGKANDYNGMDKGYESYGAGIYASGGVVENCLVRGNSAYPTETASQPVNVFGGGLYADGPVTVVNCTFVDNVAGQPAASAGGIQLGSAEAKVVNCVFFNNGGTATREFGGDHLDRFDHCASSVDNDQCDTWQVIDETAFRNWAGRDSDLNALTPQNDKPLFNTGTDADGYWQSGAISSVDLLGRNRFVKRHVDIGCLESQGGNGLLLIIR